ncbi:MAG: hypothetical protein COA42_00625 [Alteromonadaceae bacterium]|nr:MAG: hypothetical protein COA42_00625 [Alteromonadaceae bacterium]
MVEQQLTLSKSLLAELQNKHGKVLHKSILQSAVSQLCLALALYLQEISPQLNHGDCFSSLDALLARLAREQEAGKMLHQKLNELCAMYRSQDSWVAFLVSVQSSLVYTLGQWRLVNRLNAIDATDSSQLIATSGAQDTLLLHWSQCSLAQLLEVHHDMAILVSRHREFELEY